MAVYRSTSGGGSYLRPSFFGGFSFFPPVIKWLLVSNAVIWLFTDVLFARSSQWLTEWLALQPLGSLGVSLLPGADVGFWPWQLVTYMFLHGSFGHLFFNMLALWMFGMELENVWGSKRFLTYYLTCGIGGGIANLLIAPLLSQGAPTVGASGAVFGVLVAFGMLFPNRPIYIYFLLPIKAKFFVAGYIVMELLFGVMQTQSGIAHFAHLGGAAVGFAYVYLMIRGYSLDDVWKKIAGQPHAPYDKRRTRKPVQDEVFDAKFFDIKSGKPIDGADELNQEVVDAILDKINTSGYQSLTEEEKRILNEASKKIN